MYPEIHRKDFLGIYDYLAFDDDDKEMFAIQTTTKGNMGARRKKMLAKATFAWWTKGRRKSILHGWYQERGKWKVMEEELTMNDWNKWQAEEKERNSHIDTNSALYKQLFPNGHGVAA